MDIPLATAEGVPAPLTTSGLAAVAKTIRDVDEEKIQNCKEDIDTLLVFAGLFSAVMTTILVDSYQALREDPSDAMLRALERIAAQTSSYTLVNGFLNSTSHVAPTAPSFVPPSDSIHVNALWFASLVLSLVTASFGILVKQWLREYLAGEYVSPEARLRARHFRYPGLMDWKVFEIAAVLPLLLQISLGLFFAGLCIFTWSLHPTMGRTTTPLIVGWAFLVFATTFAPVFYPRCPYKTVMVITWSRFIRRHIVRRAQRMYASAIKAIRRPFKVPNQLTGLDIINALTVEKVPPVDEDDVVNDGSHDVDVLLAIDATLMDGHFLTTTMWDSLTRHQTPFRDMVRFMKTIVARRMGYNNSHPEHMYWLSEAQWLTMVRCLGDSLRRILGLYDSGLGVSDPRAVNHALYMILSPSLSPYEYPHDIGRILVRWLSDRSLCITLGKVFLEEPLSWDESEALIRGVSLPTRLGPLFDSGRDAFFALDHIVGWSIYSDAATTRVPNIPDDSSYVVSCHNSLKTALCPSALDTLNQSIIWILLHSTPEGNESPRDPPSTTPSSSSWVAEAVSAAFITLKLAAAAFGSEPLFPNYTSRLVSLSLHFLESSSSASMFIRAIIDCDDIIDDAMHEALEEVFVSVHRKWQIQKRPLLPADVLFSFLSENSIQRLSTAQVRRLCSIALHLVPSVALVDPLFRTRWQELFAALQEALCSSEGLANPADGHPGTLAKRSLKRMYELDAESISEQPCGEDTVDYESWLASPARRRSIFGDALVLYWCRLNPQAAPRDISVLEQVRHSSSEDK